MQVIFSTKSKNQNRYTISNIEGYGKIFFMGGALTTTDKGLIKRLLNHPLYARGDFKLVTNEKLVADYLDGEMSDMITEEIVEDLSLQGVKELGKALGTKSEQPALIKIEAVGKPITNIIQDIIDFYSLSEEEQEAPKEVKEVEEVEVETSGSMTAVDAANHIMNTPSDLLEGFLSEDESRKTVLKAWDEKFHNTAD